MELSKSCYTLRTELPTRGLGRGSSSPAAAALMKTLALLEDVSLRRWQQGFGRLTILFDVTGEVACVQAAASAEAILRSHGYEINGGVRAGAALSFAER